MKIETLKKRLERNRPMTSVTIRIPEDVVEDLKRLAPLLVMRSLAQLYTCAATAFIRVGITF